VSVRHGDASADALRLSSIEVHGVDVPPRNVTVDDNQWTLFNHSTATQVGEQSVDLTTTETCMEFQEQEAAASSHHVYSAYTVARAAKPIRRMGKLEVSEVQCP